MRLGAYLSAFRARCFASRPTAWPQVSALTYLALVFWMLGFPDQARRSSVAAFQCAAELDQANLTAHVHNFAGAGLAELLTDVAAVQAHADAIVDLAERHSLGYWRVNGLILRGWAMAQQGDAEAGIALMRRNVADRAALNVGWYQARYLCMLAETAETTAPKVPSACQEPLSRPFEPGECRRELIPATTGCSEPAWRVAGMFLEAAGARGREWSRPTCPSMTLGAPRGGFSAPRGPRDILPRAPSGVTFRHLLAYRTNARRHSHAQRVPL
jgi:hypothetical protein